MPVVATAGHVDHGKSTLVRALTGTDPDRLAEEHRRGLTIELGYCWTDLPGVPEVAFVDVPGHERFIATTLAGLGPVSVVMLVVAADDPWMPQAAEHLAAIDALGIEHGLLVVTRADLADPGPILVRARAEIAGTSLRDAPEVIVSGRTGDGLPRLRETLAAVLARVPATDPVADVRLWVDRRFHLRGAGTVVTGTLVAGTLAEGDALEVAGGVVRVRSVESLGRRRDHVLGVARVGLNLGGPVPDGLTRGDALLTPGAWLPTAEADVRADTGALPREPVLHLGTAQVGVRVRALGPHHARLTLERPLPLRVGDRPLLRDPGSRTVWAATVVDPLPPPLRRRGEGARRAAALEGYDGTLAAELDRRGPVQADVLRRIGVPGVVGDGWLLGPATTARLRRELTTVVAAGPASGTAVADAARHLELPEARLIDRLVEPPLVVVQGRVVDPSRAPAPHLVCALEALRLGLADDHFAAPAADALPDPATLAELARTGQVLRLATNVVLLPDAPDEAVRILAAVGSPFTTSQARQALGTSRRVALALLAHLDATGRTVRLPDDTRRLR